MERVVLDRLQPGSLGVLGSIDLEVRLSLAEECLGLPRPPEGDLVQLPGATQEIAVASQSPREHHPRLAIVRRSPQVLAQDRFGLDILLASHPVRDRVEVGQRTSVAQYHQR